MFNKLIALFTHTHDHFQGQETGEKVLWIARKHPFTLLGPFSLIFIAGLVPLVVKIFLLEQIALANFGDLFLFISSIWYGALWLMSFYILMIYSLSTAVVTDRRIIENDQISFFNRKVSELALYRIQDISVQMDGFFDTLLSFGTIEVQTAAENREFIFPDIARAAEVKNTIMQAANSHRSQLNLS